MEIKKCLLCGNEFNYKMSSGVEQKYCSKQCRMKAGNNRRFESIKNNLINEIKENAKHENENEIISTNRGNKQSMDRGYGREFTRASDGVGIISDSHLAIIKDLYEAKTETIFYKLKCENLEKELNELKIEYHNLEQELDEDEGQDKSAYNDILGGVMDEFKKDPITTLNFASGIIGNLFAPKTKVN